MHEVIGHALGQDRRAAEGQPAGGAQGAVLGARGSRAPISSRSTSCPIRSSSSSGSSPADGPGRDRPRRVRGLRAQRARAAAPRARGHADRRRPHAQPPDDRAVADGEHEGDRRARRATARPIYVMVDAEGVPAKASAGCSPRCSASSRKATTRRRRSCSRPTASTSIAKLRDEVVARVDQLNMPSYTGFVQPKLDAGRRAPTARSPTSRSRTRWI